MWQCSNCGEQVENSFDVCWNCQTDKGDLITSLGAEPKSWECDACGADVEFEDTICPSCGADISEIAGPQIFCPKCGARVDDDAEFCSSCAERISASNVVNCPSCGKSVSVDARYCKYCAADLTRVPYLNDFTSNSDYATSSTATSVRTSKNATAGNLIIFGLILAVASAGAYLWGVSYAGNFSNAMAAGIGSLVGRRDSTYDMAVMAMQFGPFGFVSGLILFVIGLVLKFR